MREQPEQVVNHELNERVLETPAELMARYPLSEEAVLGIKTSTSEVVDILNGSDQRLLAIIGPCSMDSNLLEDGTPSVIRYASQLKEFSESSDIKKNLKIVMRAPVSKPRSSVGWAGLSQTEPERAYELATQIVNMGMPLAAELLSRDDADYYQHLLTLGWIGARNVEDTTLRHVASDLDIPVLFKNSTTGSLVAAENALETAAASHVVRRMRSDGKLISRNTSGNSHTGIIFRGGNVTTPEEFAQQFLRLKGHESPIIVDCSHGNSAAFGEGKKTPEAQLACVKALRSLVVSGNVSLKGVMLESYLLAGNDPSGKTAGASLTDPCIDEARTFEELGRLAKMQEVVTQRRMQHIGTIAVRV